MPDLSNLVLYYKPTCPYCVKVLSFMEDNGLSCEMVDATDPAAAAALVEIGGKAQVPCLVRDGVAMYESDDIIAYFRGLLAGD